MSGDPKPDPRYTYQDLRPTAVSVVQLDELMAFVMQSSGTGIVGAIIAGVKLLVVIAYVIAREKIQAQMAEYNKQRYEQGQAGGNQGQIDQDNLGGQKKP